MNKLKNILIGLVATISLTSVAYAGSFGLGVTGSYTKIEADGSETEGAGDAEITKTNVDNNATIISGFLEYSLDDATWANGTGNGLTFGIEYTPGAADVSEKVFSRTDATSNALEAVQDDGTRTANAEVEKYVNAYLEIPVYSALYVKAGYSQIDVITNETSTITTSGKYGNKTLNGTNLGIGFKGVTTNNIIWKLAYEATNFDTLNLTSTTGNKLKADLDTSAVSLSLGYRF